MVNTAEWLPQIFSKITLLFITDTQNLEFSREKQNVELSYTVYFKPRDVEISVYNINIARENATYKT